MRKPAVTPDSLPRGSECTLFDRRRFLLASAVLLVGCAENRALSTLPGVPWPSERPTFDSPHPPRSTYPKRDGSRIPTNSLLFPNIIPRRRWARGNPVPVRMNRMLPVRYITVHHDGMDRFTGSTQGDAMARLERIRRFHRETRGWGDIGYHFAVDRSGRIYECRPLGWQGAHVKDHNEGNLGVVALGNFDEQTPTSAQVEGVRRQVALLMQRYYVPISRVRTHQEWAPTICPGRHMQAQMIRMRASGTLA